jgi:hypothetical protein
VILQESGGNTLVDWHSKRSGFEAAPERVFAADLGPAHYCPGYYHIAIVGFAADGKQLFLSKPFRFRVEGEFLGATRVQPVAGWRDASEALAPQRGPMTIERV